MLIFRKKQPQNVIPVTMDLCDDYFVPAVLFTICHLIYAIVNYIVEK